MSAVGTITIRFTDLTEIRSSGLGTRGLCAMNDGSRLSVAEAACGISRNHGSASWSNCAECD